MDKNNYGEYSQDQVTPTVVIRTAWHCSRFRGLGLSCEHEITLQIVCETRFYCNQTHH